MKLNSLDNLPIAFVYCISYFVLPYCFVSYSKIFEEEGLSLIGQKRTGNTAGVNILNSWFF